MESDLKQKQSSKPHKHLWANICPRKLYWELEQTTDKSLFKEWYFYPEILAESFRLLNQAGVTGIRLNIFNYELTFKQKSTDWQALELALNLAQQNQLQVHLCLGPWQYPLWPGLRLPNYMTASMTASKVESQPNTINYLDNNLEIFEWGNWWLESQLERYGNDPRIAGFYLGNEWPNKQALENDVETNWKISPAYMSQAMAICHAYTDKPIIMNTNLDASQPEKIINTYQKLWQFAPKQFRLALDVYPSRETWRLAPELRFRRQHLSWAEDVKRLQSKIPVQVMVGEFEAQPWGAGESWAQWWQNSSGNFDHRLKFSPKILNQWFIRYLNPAPINEITLWGAEFWLTGQLLGYGWPLKLVRQWSQLFGQEK